MSGITWARWPGARKFHAMRRALPAKDRRCNYESLCDVHWGHVDLPETLRTPPKGARCKKCASVLNEEAP